MQGEVIGLNFECQAVPRALSVGLCSQRVRRRNRGESKWEQSWESRSHLAGTILLGSRLIYLVFGRCASLFGAYVFRFNMRAPHALHIGQILCAPEDTTN